MMAVIGIGVMSIILLCSFIGCVYAIFLLLGTFSAAPFVVTTDRARHTMIELAHISPGMHVLEIGSGEGSVCIEAAQHGAIAVGIELNPVLVWYARLRAALSHVSQRTTFICQNFWNAPFPKQTQVVFFYLLPGAMSALLSKFRTELQPGTVIISHAFPLPELRCVEKQGNVFVYRLEG